MKLTPRDFMELAIEAAKKCKPEDDERPYPKVGAVVADKAGKLLVQAFRGQQEPGEHAEFTALEKTPLKERSLQGVTVYTTLEPCTTRKHSKVPCAERLIDRKVGRVVIGMLDPNPNILGRGVLRLRDAGIAVEFFPPELMAKLEELNRDFSRAHQAELAPPVTDALLEKLRGQSLDDWYLTLNRIYWNRNFQRDAAAIFTHLVEVLGSLSVIVSKKNEKGAPVHKIVAKALAWWLALCGKLGIRNVQEMLWGKFPGACPYCFNRRHDPVECDRRKKARRGPDWEHLDRMGEERIAEVPTTIGEWQRMFAEIYSS